MARAKAKAEAAAAKPAPKVVKQPPVLVDRTQKLVASLERKLGTPFLAYWNSVNGSVCQNDVMAAHELLAGTKRGGTVCLFVKSDGGDGKASLRIVNLLRQHFKRVVALVPLNCASAATMLALGADEIRMGPLAYLTPVDTSITHDLSPLDRDNDRVGVALDELSRVVRLWRREARDGEQNPYQALFAHVHPLVIGAVDRASSLSTRLCTEILSYHLRGRRQAEKISHHLNSAYPSHGYPITFREARRIGLPVKPLDPGVGELLVALNEVYSEMGQTAITDFDEFNHHDNAILNIHERAGVQIHFQVSKDWHYRKEERRWVSMNDESAWLKTERRGGKETRSKLFIR